MSDLATMAQALANVLYAKRGLSHDYPTELAYEALLDLHAQGIDTGVMERLRWFTERTGMSPERAVPWQAQQFHNLGYPYYKALGHMESHQEAYLEQTRKWVEQAPRSATGALRHHCLHEPTGTLIDMVQAYLIRLIRANRLSGDAQYLDLAVQEVRRYRDELCDEASGCWHQGRGWLEGDYERSPGCWSRGQGWVLHGFSVALPLLERGTQLDAMFVDLVDALLPLQRPDGLWNQLIDDPKNDTPDSSGTALIYEALEVGLRLGLLTTEHARPAAHRAWDGLCAYCWNPSGLVGHVSLGPGPIWEQETWRTMPGLSGDVHGLFSMLFAIAARGMSNS